MNAFEQIKTSLERGEAFSVVLAYQFTNRKGEGKLCKSEDGPTWWMSVGSELFMLTQVGPDYLEFEPLMPNLLANFRAKIKVPSTNIELLEP